MRLRSFFLTEMPRPRGDAMWAVLDWAAQQKGTFTIRDLYNVYVRNGGRADSLGDNIQSFTTGIMKYVAQPGKYKINKRTGQPKDYSLSQKRPIMQVQRGARGAGGAALMKWGLDKPLRDPTAAKFVDVEDPSAGDAMDNLEAMIGPEKLKAAMARWKKMGHTDKAVADIKGTIPKKGWMDAMHILMDLGGGAESDEEAEDELDSTPAAASPQQDDDEEDYGEIGDEIPEFDPDEFEDDEESPVFAAPAKSAPPPPAAKEPEPEPEEPEPTPQTQQQAGAANFIKPSAATPARKSSIASLMKKFKK